MSVYLNRSGLTGPDFLCPHPDRSAGRKTADVRHRAFCLASLALRWHQTPRTRSRLAPRFSRPRPLAACAGMVGPPGGVPRPGKPIDAAKALFSHCIWWMAWRPILALAGRPAGCSTSSDALAVFFEFLTLFGVCSATSCRGVRSCARRWPATTGRTLHSLADYMGLLRDVIHDVPCLLTAGDRRIAGMLAYNAPATRPSLSSWQLVSGIAPEHFAWFYRLQSRRAGFITLLAQFNPSRQCCVAGRGKVATNAPTLIHLLRAPFCCCAPLCGRPDFRCGPLMLPAVLASCRGDTLVLQLRFLGIAHELAGPWFTQAGVASAADGHHAVR